MRRICCKYFLVVLDSFLNYCIIKESEKNIMILQVGKKYVTKDGFIYTIISTNRKNKDGHNVVAECERVDDRGNKCSVFQTFTPDGKNTNSEFNLIKEYKPRLKVELTIDLPEELNSYNIDEAKSLLLQGLDGLRLLNHEIDLNF